MPNLKLPVTERDHVRGPARAPLDCSVSLGGTDAKPGLVVRASSVDVRCADDPSVPRLVAAVLGSPALPRDGAWSLSRIGAADPAPTALAPTFPVPVVRPRAPTPGSDRWHLADQADILKLDDGDRVTGSNLTLQQVKDAVRGANGKGGR